jgi:hypothetical protein
MMERLDGKTRRAFAALRLAAIARDAVNGVATFPCAPGVKFDIGDFVAVNDDGYAVRAQTGPQGSRLPLIGNAVATKWTSTTSGGTCSTVDVLVYKG